MSFDKFEHVKELPSLGKGFLDCGAYSVLTMQWETLPLDAYIRFVEEHYAHFELIAAPDVIGSAEKTLANLLYFIHKLTELGLWEKIASHVLVTYHLGDKDLPLLRKLVKTAYDNGISWLAVGGIVTPGTSLTQRFIGITEVLHIVKKELRLPFKIHLFGGYAPEYIAAFLPDSVDSSTYMQKARMLQSFRYLPNSWTMQTRKAPRDSNTALMAFVEEQFKPLYALTGITNEKELFEQLSKLPDGVKFWIVNGLYMRLFEQEVRTIKPNFRYWMTVASLDDGLRYGKYVSDFLFSKMWKDASLVAFPSFYNPDTRLFTGTQKLKLLQ